MLGDIDKFGYSGKRSKYQAGCPFPDGSVDLICRKCSNLKGYLEQKVGKNLIEVTFWCL